MTVKEQIVEIMREEGYDFIRACEEADRVMAKLRKSERQSMIFVVRRTGRQFMLSKKEKEVK